MTEETIAEPEGDGYKLRRDYLESVRLTGQHHMLQQRQGWLLHPDIEKSLQGQANPQIADVPAGNGIWAVELAEKMPHATIWGLDISIAQYPPNWTLPSNTKFETYDLLQDVPPQYQNRFDVVHVRLLLLAGPRVDKSVFIDKFYKMLKPGGWLQWDELSYPVIMSANPSSNSKVGFEKTPARIHPAVKTVEDAMSAEQCVGWINDIDKVFSDSGFLETQKFVVPVKKSLLKYETSLVTEVIVELTEVVRSNSKSGEPMFKKMEETAKDMESMYTDSDGEMNGEMFSYNFIVGIGRKV